MKKFIKEIAPAIILAFVGSFMIFIYEPINIFAASTEDFWFDFSSLLKSNLIFMIIAIFAVSFFSIIVYLISKWSKKKIIYTIYIMILTILFVVSYIQGNFLSSNLPTLDGTPIN